MRTSVITNAPAHNHHSRRSIFRKFARVFVAWSFAPVLITRHLRKNIDLIPSGLSCRVPRRSVRSDRHETSISRLYPAAPGNTACLAFENERGQATLTSL